MAKLKTLYLKLDKKVVKKFPKWFRRSAPLIAMAMIYFDVSILLLTKFISRLLQLDLQNTEIGIRLSLYVVIIVFGPIQVIRIIKKIK